MGRFKRAWQELRIKQSKSQSFISAQTWGGYAWPTQSMYTNQVAYKKVKTVFSCIDEISRNASQLPLKFFKITEDSEGNIEEEDISKEERFEVFYKPNKWESGQQWLKKSVEQLLLTGENFIEIVYSNKNKIGYPREFHLHIPTRIKIKYDENGINGFEEMIGVSPPIYYKTEDMVLFQIKDPFEDFRGQSPLDALKNEISLSDNAINYGNNFFLNGCQLSGIIKTPPLSNKTFDRFKEKLITFHTGVKNSFKLLFIESEEANFIQTGVTQADMNYIEQLQYMDKAIAGVLGVPPVLIGLTESQSHANVQDQLGFFWSETMVPFIKLYSDMRNYFLLPLFTKPGENIECRHDFSNVEQLQENKNEKHKRARESFLSGGIDLNEYRQEIDKSPLDDEKLGAMRIILATYMPLDDLLYKIEESEESEIEEEKSYKIIKFNELKSEINKISDESLQKLLKNEKRTNAWRDGQNRRKNNITQIIIQTKKIFEKQRERVIANLNKIIKKSINLKAETEAVNITETQIKSILLDEEIELKIFQKAYKGIQLSAIAAAVKRIEELVGEGIEIVPDSDVVKRLIKSRTVPIKGITDYTNKRIKIHVLQAIDKGETIQQLTDRINNNIFKEATTTRAKRIGITEIQSIHNGAQIEAMRKLGFVERKMWISQRDALVRDEHVQLDGEIVQLDEAFSNGLQYPQEPNCRCDVIPVLEKE